MIWDTPKKAHVGQSTGKEEWYTPPDIVELVCAVMGGIDLDPASCEKANTVVKADKYFTREDDALDELTSWKTTGGRVFLNPPYRQPLIYNFAKRLEIEVDIGNIKQAIWLSNNGTETKWGSLIQRRSLAVCFPARRIAFLNENLKPENRPLQGQMIAAYGSDMDVKKFCEQFDWLGPCHVNSWTVFYPKV